MKMVSDSEKLLMSEGEFKEFEEGEKIKKRVKIKVLKETIRQRKEVISRFQRGSKRFTRSSKKLSRGLVGLLRKKKKGIVRARVGFYEQQFGPLPRGKVEERKPLDPSGDLLANVFFRRK